MEFTLNHIIPHPLNDLSFNKESVWDNELSISSNQSYIIKANSGKGKSTFISLLYGLRSDFNGELKINNKNSKSLTIKEWSELRTNKLSIVFQDMRLFDDLPLWDNLMVKNELTKHKSEAQITEYINLLGLDGKQHQLCGTLSLGQQQRVAIIRSLLQPFEFLLMDEPFSHLDETNTKLALDIIKHECNNQQASFLISSLGSNHHLTNVKALTI